MHYCISHSTFVLHPFLASLLSCCLSLPLKSPSVQFITPITTTSYTTMATPAGCGGGVMIIMMRKKDVCCVVSLSCKEILHQHASPRRIAADFRGGTSESIS